MKVLIVDDNADDRKLLRLNLERHGCAMIIEAHDGQDGLAQARAHHPDLIISDALMPRMDGFQFLRTIKTDAAFKNVPFIFFSAVYTGSKDEELSLRLGAEAFISKPKEPEEFWKEITAVLKNFASGELRTANHEPLEEELEYLRGYSRIVAAKLEEKVRELEMSLARSKEAKETLRIRAQEYRSLAENMPDNIVRYDREGRTLYVNPSMERTLGIPAENTIGKSPMELHPDGRFADYIAMLKKVIATGVGSEFDMAFPDGSGNILYHQIRFVPERDNEGAITSILAIGRDITERRRAKEELLKLSSAIEQSPVTIVMTDAKGTIEFVNPKFTQLTGYLPEEVIGKNPRLLKSGETPPEEYKNLWETITAGNVWHGEFKNRKKNGALFREYATIAPVRNSNCDITHYIAIKEDITEKRKLEDQLRQAQKMEAIGQIAGGVAHDFNNLLQIITTYGFLIQQQLKECGLPATFVDEQMDATRRGVELTSSLLTFSRKQAQNPKPLDLNRILTESRKLLKRVIGEDIAFEVIPAPYEIIVRADEGGMHQILMNLATNARDAMPGGGNLTISITREMTDDAFMLRHGCDNSGGFALITVTDSGSGMSQENLQRIFEPFFTTKEQGRGTGLGLAIIYGIIQQHNGFIEVDSEKGKGTSFRIYLPLLNDQTAANRRDIKDEITHGSGTILLVEDDVMVRRSLKAVISSCGYSVLEAADGEAAVQVFRENAGVVDLVIMDMIMPKKNGWETLKEIRAIKPEIRNIFLSGYTADILDSKGINDGGEILIMKPVNPPQLLEAIGKLLKQNGSDSFPVKKDIQKKPVR